MIGVVTALLLSLLNPAARSAVGQTNDSSKAAAGSYKSDLKLVRIEIFNSLKFGSLLSGPGVSFGANTVKFVTWRAEFRCANGDGRPSGHEVAAEYFAPDGHELGLVNDFKMVAPGDKVIFAGRVGNSAGGAFLQGQYTIKFYLDDHYLGQRHFDIVPLPADGAQTQWYLKWPPAQANANQPNLFAPMTEWTANEIFASQAECQKFRSELVWLGRSPEFNSASALSGEKGIKLSADRARKFSDFAECVAADDPSLKPN